MVLSLSLAIAVAAVVVVVVIIVTSTILLCCLHSFDAKLGGNYVAFVGLDCLIKTNIPMKRGGRGGVSFLCTRFNQPFDRIQFMWMPLGGILFLCVCVD